MEGCWVDISDRRAATPSAACWPRALLRGGCAVPYERWRSASSAAPRDHEGWAESEAQEVALVAASLADASRDEDSRAPYDDHLGGVANLGLGYLESLGEARVAERVRIAVSNE